MNNSAGATTRETRIFSGFVSFILLFAFNILYLTPEKTGTHFAWEINPSLTALFMGAGYLGGAYFFLIASLSRHWHAVKSGFPAVWVFTIFMFAATLLHLDKFNRNFAFYGWFILYLLTPIFLPWLLWRNRSADDGKPAEKDVIVPGTVRLFMRIASIFLGTIAFTGFTIPDLMIQIWPWDLTPLTTRVICGWFSLVAVGSFIISKEPRWSGWRGIFVSIVIWVILVIIGSFIYAADFKVSTFNWLIPGLFVQLVLMVGLYIFMEAKLKRA